MRIDIHTHTKKCKKGDADTRNISPERFDEIIRLTDVKILAITNHNHFDLNQFEELKNSVEDVCQVWPGIELDVVEEGRRGHLIVIVSPEKASDFEEQVKVALNGVSADNFSISLEDTVKYFDGLDPIYIAHYYAKKPNLTDDDLEKLESFVSNRLRILKEATNSISAGIYISHGHNSIYGSDVQDWNSYQEIAKGLPELRLPVESFEQFCLLLDKDDVTINTILNKKTPEPIQLNVFGVAELIDLNLYNDINILFGSKGTGKTEILRSISKYYNDLGIKNEVYESSALKLEDVYDLKGTKFNVDVKSLGIDNCSEEFQRLRGASEKNITSISTYLRYFSEEETNRISKNLKVKSFTQLDDSSEKRSFDAIKKYYDDFGVFLETIESNTYLEGVIGEDLLKELIEVLSKIIQKLKFEAGNKFLDFRSLTFFNNLVQTFVSEISKKTGQPQKPITTGFKEYASNRIRIERDIKHILSNISTGIKAEEIYVGNLGEKGHLKCRTELKIQDGTFVNVKFQPVKKVTKNPQKIIANKLQSISKHLYKSTLFEKISEFKQEDNSDSINSIDDLLLFHRYFTIGGDYYMPSNGESSMVLLHNELMQDKEIYIIDEPERSLGNDYISEVIVPLLKDRARSGKKVIIATHDANIAVRTLPYNSIYREHDALGYYTYQGNPFSNNLSCTNPDKEDIDWKEISMKTLEGGREAFGERGKIYGNL